MTTAPARSRSIGHAVRGPAATTPATMWALLAAQPPTAPQARQAKSKPTMSRRSRVGVVDTDRSLAMRPRGAAAR